MRPRLFSLMLTIATTFLALTTLGTITALAAPISGPDGDTGLQTHAPYRTTTARRTITPTFGIDDTLSLSADGSSVLVAGHGECLEGYDTFIIRVRVTQEPPGGHAIAKSAEFSCESTEWNLLATVPGSKVFEEGTAHVYAKAMLFGEDESTLIIIWDKPVTLALPVNGTQIE